MNERGYIFVLKFAILFQKLQFNFNFFSFLSNRKSPGLIWRSCDQWLVNLLKQNLSDLIFRDLSEQRKLKNFIFPRRKSNGLSTFQENENLRGLVPFKRENSIGQILFQNSRRNSTGTFLPRSQENLTGISFLPLWRFLTPILLIFRIP